MAGRSRRAQRRDHARQGHKRTKEKSSIQSVRTTSPGLDKEELATTTTCIPADVAKKSTELFTQDKPLAQPTTPPARGLLIPAFRAPEQTEEGAASETTLNSNPVRDKPQNTPNQVAEGRAGEAPNMPLTSMLHIPLRQTEDDGPGETPDKPASSVPHIPPKQTEEGSTGMTTTGIQPLNTTTQNVGKHIAEVSPGKTQDKPLPSVPHISPRQTEESSTGMTTTDIKPLNHLPQNAAKQVAEGTPGEASNTPPTSAPHTPPKQTEKGSTGETPDKPLPSVPHILSNPLKDGSAGMTTADIEPLNDLPQNAAKQVAEGSTGETPGKPLPSVSHILSNPTKDGSAGMTTADIEPLNDLPQNAAKQVVEGSPGKAPYTPLISAPRTQPKQTEEGSTGMTATDTELLKVKPRTAPNQDEKRSPGKSPSKPLTTVPHTLSKQTEEGSKGMTTTARPLNNKCQNAPNREEEGDTSEKLKNSTPLNIMAQKPPVPSRHAGHKKVAIRPRGSPVFARQMANWQAEVAGMRELWARDAILVWGSWGSWKLCLAQLSFEIDASGSLVGGPMELAWCCCDPGWKGPRLNPAAGITADVAAAAAQKWQQLYQGPPPPIAVEPAFPYC